MFYQHSSSTDWKYSKIIGGSMTQDSTLGVSIGDIVLIEDWQKTTMPS